MISIEHTATFGACKPDSEVMARLPPHAPSDSMLSPVEHREVRSAVLGSMAGDGAQKPGTNKLVEVLAAAEHQDGAQAVERLLALSPREVDVIVQLVGGMTSKMAAYNLGISAKTLEIHRARIMDKLGCASPIELGRRWEAAVATAKRLGMRGGV